MTEVSEAAGSTGLVDAELAALTAVHNARMAAIDGLIPAAAVPSLTPSTAEPTPTYGLVNEALLAVPGAVAVARWSTVDPDSLSASWGSLASNSLVSVRVAGDPLAVDRGGYSAEAAMDCLLAQWASRPGPVDVNAYAGGDTGAGLMWPSRDTAMTRTFLRHGLSARVHVAARLAGRPAPVSPEPPGLVVRDLMERDVDAAAALQLEVIRWDAQFDGVTLRDSSPARARDDVVEQLDNARPSAWVAESNGVVVGLLTIAWPPDADWISALVAADPARIAYLGCLSIAPGRRSAGVGAALARFIHAELDAAGISVTLLHHSATNPLSTPFWHRWNYRPLWTSWQARPHSTLR
ncbi:MAG TPA: GNAT family N-acetyltransferase [Micromonosporaceae bacterium]|nr:GNAT family N-acetyltransferase [Micromonosporaceae bacterium]